MPMKCEDHRIFLSEAQVFDRGYKPAPLRLAAIFLLGRKKKNTSRARMEVTVNGHDLVTIDVGIADAEGHDFTFIVD
jgi:hypothetical protein